MKNSIPIVGGCVLTIAGFVFSMLLVNEIRKEIRSIWEDLDAEMLEYKAGYRIP